MQSPIPNKPVTGDEIRRAFLDFYSAKSHTIIPSASLIPEDPTVMLTIAGMLPFKSVFLGLKERPSKRATSSQKCIRTNDIENVGVTARHHTYFEMLGNFSFGDYFKHDAIRWSWELITTIYKLKTENIIVSVFDKDEESKKIWEETIGVDPNKIIKLGKKDNFWSAGSTGPCGPCSELYYDFYPERGAENIDLEDGTRFIEFYNLVFMEYNRDEKGNLTDLKSKNIDTGMGLERMAQILQKKDNNYETDLIFPIIETACFEANIDYFKADDKKKISLKILGDHTRAVVQLISDGVIASNLGRGYVLRRLIRRMVRHGRLLDIKDKFISKLAFVAIKLMGESYPDLKLNSERIIREINLEEIRFLETLDRGERLLNEIILSGASTISGSKAFELYDTYGFPLELTKEILEEKNVNIDLQGFETEMAAQKKRAKDAAQKIDLNLKGSIEREIEIFDKTIFEGYKSLICDSVVKGIFFDSKAVNEASVGQQIQVILDRTSFYGESGGQVGDVGIITSSETEIRINKVIRNKEVFLHCGVIEKGNIKVNELVQTVVDKSNRSKAESNHTATHLLQSALKIILDSNVSQRGSLVAFNKLRFDFNSPSSLTDEHISKVESLVNLWIMEDHPIEVKTMRKREALQAGALAMFGEKYGEIVRVVDVPGVSMELCGGTHVKRTSELGVFKIISEVGISSGIRRIEALSGQSVLTYLSERNIIINQLSDLLKANPNQLVERVCGIQSELLIKTKEIKKLKSELAFQKYSSLISFVEKIGSYSILIKELNDLDSDSLNSAANDLTVKLGTKSLVVLGGIPTKDSKKLLFVVSLGQDLVTSGLHAGKFINKIAQICSGGGGGKANIAQAGARNIDKLSDALSFAKNTIMQELKDQPAK